MVKAFDGVSNKACHTIDRRFITYHHYSVTNLKRKVNTGRPKPPRLEELWEHYGISTDDIAARSAEWFQGGGQAHDARFDTAATYMCLLEATKKGDVRGVL